MDWALGYFGRAIDSASSCGTHTREEHQRTTTHGFPRIDQGWVLTLDEPFEEGFSRHADRRWAEPPQPESKVTMYRIFRVLELTLQFLQGVACCCCGVCLLRTGRG